MAMMASSNQFGDNGDGRPIETDDLIDPDDPSLNDLDDPMQPDSSDREPLTGNIQPDSSSTPLPQNYLNSSIPGEDRRAPLNTLDESVWATVSRDLKAVWEKMRLVLWPKYLLGGALTRGGALSDAERGESEGLTSNVRGIVGQLQNPEIVLQGSMSEGLRNWDLWGPLLFCLLLSLFLSLRALPDQKSFVFSGVFAIVWIGEAVVTMQIKLLGGNIHSANMSSVDKSVDTAKPGPGEVPSAPISEVHSPPKSTDEESTERPVRQKLSETAIEAEASAHTSVEASDSDEGGSSKNVSRKRAYDAVEDEDGDLTDANDTKHVRKRSRSSEKENGQKYNTESEAAADDAAPKSPTHENTTASPTRKRSFDESEENAGDVESDRPRKRSKSPEIEKGTDVTPQVSVKEKPSRDEQSFAAQNKDDASKPNEAIQETQTSPEAFAASGFAALARSSDSPFAAMGPTDANKETGTSTSGFAAVGQNAQSSFGSRTETTSVFDARSKAIGNAFVRSAFASPAKSPFSGGFGAPLQSFASGPESTAAGLKQQSAVKRLGEESSDEGSDDEEEGSEEGETKGNAAEDSETASSKEASGKLRPQQRETGEEGETTIHTVRAKLYVNVDKEWKERGLGNLKINISKSCVQDDDGNMRTLAGRFLMRAEGSHRVVLNSPIESDLQMRDPISNGPPTKSAKSLLFLASIDGILRMCQVKVKDYTAVEELFETVERVKDTLGMVEYFLSCNKSLPGSYPIFRAVFPQPGPGQDDDSDKEKIGHSGHQQDGAAGLEEHVGGYPEQHESAAPPESLKVPPPAAPSFDQAVAPADVPGTDHEADYNYYMEHIAPGHARSFAEAYARTCARAYAHGREAGYADGYQSGRKDGYDAGYQVGYDPGYEDGRDEGFTAGWKHSLEQAELSPPESPHPGPQPGSPSDDAGAVVDEEEYDASSSNAAASESAEASGSESDVEDDLPFVLTAAPIQHQNPDTSSWSFFEPTTPAFDTQADYIPL
ncbi:MAG: hypothetical protein M1831_005154 [Alyxoria varia]|nr:MAG: hypothetical protein M1831_005154 [Alyxoria varia]